MNNDVWKAVPKLDCKSVVYFEWIYKIKYMANQRIEKYKSKFVAYVFSQKEGIDYEETFSFVARYTSIITIMELVAKT